MAFGAERRKDNDANDGFGFFGVFKVGDGTSSVEIEGIRRCSAIGGGAAESKDEARVRTGLASDRRGRLSSPSRNMAGPILWLHQGRASKSMFEGRDSRSSSSPKRGDFTPDDLGLMVSGMLSTIPFNGREKSL